LLIKLKGELYIFQKVLNNILLNPAASLFLDWSKELQKCFLESLPPPYLSPDHFLNLNPFLSILQQYNVQLSYIS